MPRLPPPFSAPGRPVLRSLCLGTCRKTPCVFPDSKWPSLFSGTEQYLALFCAHSNSKRVDCLFMSSSAGLCRARGSLCTVSTQHNV